MPADRIPSAPLAIAVAAPAKPGVGSVGDAPAPVEPRPLSVRRLDVSPGEIRLEVAGEIDLATVDDFIHVLDGAVADSNPSSLVVIDMAGVTFLSASGIGLLVGAARSASDLRSTLRLVRCTDAVTRALQCTATLQLLADR